MAFLENKRREEEKQQQTYPQSADFKKAQVPLSPIGGLLQNNVNTNVPGANAGNLLSN